MACAAHEEALPMKDIPGDPCDNAGRWPHLDAIKDRLDFFWFQGETEFWKSRIDKYGSTVFRVNMPPSPPGFPANPVVMLLDQKSYPVLFDNSKVDKKDVLLANYMPSTSFYGGIRPCIYQDTTEEKHTRIKAFLMDLIKSNASKWIPETEKAAGEAFAALEEEVEKEGKAGLNSECQKFACKVLIRTIVGRDPGAPGEASLGDKGPTYFFAWLGPQLAPVSSLGIPHVLEEPLVHTFPIPYATISFFHKKTIKFFETYATEILDMAESKYELERQEALHNLIFTVVFNAFGGLSIFLPSLVDYVGREGEEVQRKLREEVRGAVEEAGGELGVGAVEQMELVRSVVYESLRMAPPVPYQYGRAREDLIVESHDARYLVKKGEIISGCQPVASRDPKIFDNPDQFVAERFVGEQGRKLIHYVLWSNGHSDHHANPHNKQCAASDFVPFLSQTFLACLFLRYDSFSTLPPVVRGSSVNHTLSSLHKRPPSSSSSSN